MPTELSWPTMPERNLLNAYVNELTHILRYFPQMLTVSGVTEERYIARTSELL